MAAQQTCLCIVSGDRLRGSDFLAALRASLRPQDQLEIIMDRRCSDVSGEWDRAEDRRNRPQVDQALRANGFAVVPAPSPKESRTPVSLLIPEPAPTRLSQEDDDDEERLEAIRSFKRERSGGLAPWLVGLLMAAATAAFFLSPTGQTLTKSLTQRASPGAPGPADRTPATASDASTVTRGPVVAEKPGNIESPARALGPEIPPPDRSTSGTPASVAGSEPGPSRDAGSGSSRRDTITPPADSAAPSAATGTGTRSRSRSSETIPPSSSPPVPRSTAALSSTEVAPRVLSPRFAGLPRVELTRESGASGGGYAVRITDPAGKPLADAEVLLIARMGDGTVENVRMGFVPEQGTYRGTLPPTRSAPVDLRIRGITGDKRVEIPLGP